MRWDGSGSIKGMVSVEVPLHTLPRECALSDLFYSLSKQTNLGYSATVNVHLVGLKLVLLRLDRCMKVRNGKASVLKQCRLLPLLI